MLRKWVPDIRTGETRHSLTCRWCSEENSKVLQAPTLDNCSWSHRSSSCVYSTILSRGLIYDSWYLYSRGVRRPLLLAQLGTGIEKKCASYRLRDDWSRWAAETRTRGIDALDKSTAKLATCWLYSAYWMWVRANRFSAGLRRRVTMLTQSTDQPGDRRRPRKS